MKVRGHCLSFNFKSRDGQFSFVTLLESFQIKTLIVTFDISMTDKKHKVIDLTDDSEENKVGVDDIDDLDDDEVIVVTRTNSPVLKKAKAAKDDVSKLGHDDNGTFY